MNDLLVIAVDMRTYNGYMEYCRFTLVGEGQDSGDLFKQLKGIAATNLTVPLRLSLVNFSTNPHEVLAIKYCRLDELAWNCKLITKEIFKHYNMG